MELFREVLNNISIVLLPLIIVAIPVYGLLRGVDVYGEFVEGAKEGFTTAVRVIPFFIAIFFAIGMFRASGAMELATDTARPVMDRLGIPPEILPMAIVRPLSGSGGLAVVTDMVKTHGADSYISRVGGTIYGSAETTFYVLAVYFGAVGIKKTRHALAAGLIADIAGVFFAVWAVKWLVGS